MYFERFVDALICVIPFLTGTQAFGGGISPYEAKFRLMRIAKNIDVRHDSKRHNEPVFALQMNTLLLGQGCHQGKGLAHNRSWTDDANAFSISRQFRRHLPVRELVRGPYGHHQTNRSSSVQESAHYFERELSLLGHYSG